MVFENIEDAPAPGQGSMPNNAYDGDQPEKALNIKLVLLFLLLLSCDDSLFNQPLGYEPQEVIEEPTHDKDIQQIWNTSCGANGAACHGASADGGLILDLGYDAVVGRPARGASDISLVEPGDLDASYLWLKLLDRQGEVDGDGGAMPLAGSLSLGARATLQNWVLGGCAP